MVQPWLEPADLDNPSDPYAEYAINAATYILWGLSGRKYHGVSHITEQYVCPEYDVPLGCSWEDSGSFLNQYGFSSYLVPSYIDIHHQDFGTRFRLRQQPVRKIDTISVGGVVLPSASYVLRNGADVMIQSGSCSSLCEGPIVTYTYGVPPPDAGKLAAIELANELIKGYNNDGDCALPKNTTNITRQNLTITVFDPESFLDKGRLGIYSADLFIAVSNPGRAKKPAKVFSPDYPTGYTKR